MYAVGDTEVDGKTAVELTTELAAMGGALMAEVLERLGEIAPVPQPEDGVTHAAKIDKLEAKLVFTRPAQEVERQVRAFNPAPGAWFEYEGERIKVHSAKVGALSGEPGTVLDHGLAIACQVGSIVPTIVQRAGRGPVATEELLRGFAIPVGAKLQ
jgi:methionyl-tRNA formyltransferase